MLAKDSRFTSLQLLVFAVVMLFAGFLFGSLHYDINFFSFAQDDVAPAYEGDTSAPGRPESALNTARNVEEALSYSADRAKPAVVTIFTRKEVSARGFPFRSPRGDDRFDEFFRRFFEGPNDRSRQVTGLGSGMIIRSNGYILTNYHVIAEADEIEVRLNNRESVKAEVVGTDEASDLAVLKIERTELPTLDFADSDNLKVGDFAIAIGAPFQMSNSVSVGHVSALHRAINARQYEDLIQTDAAINQGNSGGPLVNLEGEVIGVNTLILSQGSRGSQGVGFAISSNLARRTANDLIEFGEVKRPWLGVVIQEITQEMRDQVGTDRGVIVSEVSDESPAKESGLQPGDVILEFGGEQVNTPHDLQRKVLARQIGEEVTVTVQREGGETESLTVELAEMPSRGDESPTTDTEEAPESDRNPAEDLGLELTTLDEKQARERGLPRPAVQVQRIMRGSPAQQAKIQSGDLILALGRFGNEPVTSVEKFNEVIGQLRERGEDRVFVHVHRNGNTILTLLPLTAE